jgi:hypothetical protein
MNNRDTCGSSLIKTIIRNEPWCFATAGNASRK